MDQNAIKSKVDCIPLLLQYYYNIRNLPLYNKLNSWFMIYDLFYVQIIEKNDIPVDDESLTKRISGGNKNVARCGICLQWFSDHTTMLTHLQTHSDNSHKSYICHICNKSFKEQSQLLKHEVSLPARLLYIIICRCV